MLREKTVFGPIHSRRLGNSLGLNILPENGKFCNFDCIYCECGWNKDGKDDQYLPKAYEVKVALEAKLKECAQNGTPIDSITFSGDGESTLNPDFPQIVDDTMALRDQYFPHAQVSILSNGTRAHIPAVFAALRKVDKPIMKIDAPTNEWIAKINRPASGYDVQRVIDALKQFKGDFILQTMMLQSDDFDSANPEIVNPWMDIVRELRPREIMVYTIDRPTPQEGLVKFSEEKMRKLVQPLIDEGFNVQIRG